MNTMQKQKVSCGRCGTVEVPIGIMRMRRLGDEKSQEIVATWTCPKCLRHERSKPLRAPVIVELEMRGVKRPLDHEDLAPFVVALGPKHPSGEYVGASALLLPKLPPCCCDACLDAA